MNAKRLTLCLGLLVVASRAQEAQPEAEEEPLPTTMEAHVAEPAAEPATVATPEPVDIAPESVPETSAAPAPAPEPEPDATPEQADKPTEAAPTPEATTATEPDHEPEPVPGIPFVPAAEPTQPDYQNDEGASHVEETPKMPETEQQPAKVPETETPEETSNGAAAKETTPSLSCFSCTGEQKGACSSKPRETITCSKTSKGCFTLIKRDTRLITRGCQSELTEEGTTYCHKEPMLCEMCADTLCNRQEAPAVAAAPQSSLARAMLCFVSGLLILG